MINEPLPAHPPPSGRFRSPALRIFAKAMDQNLDTIDRLLATVPPGGTLLDLGCNDGERTLRFAQAAQASEAHGVELFEARARQAEARGVTVTIADLSEPLPLPDAAFDIVVSNQVLEHVANPDNFLRECYRVLRPTGVAVISTENLASWHNVLALLLGWQPFSLANVTETVLGLGNPLALRRNSSCQTALWAHHYVFAYRGLRELFIQHGFRVQTIVGAGYYPLPRVLARVDPRHAAFLTLKAAHA